MFHWAWPRAGPGLAVTTLSLALSPYILNKALPREIFFFFFLVILVSGQPHSQLSLVGGPAPQRKGC